MQLKGLALVRSQSSNESLAQQASSVMFSY
jgi:hypothetical protein